MPYADAAKRAFVQHKRNAALRGVGWRLTFEQWLSVWRESGKWGQRGRLRGQYCMSRYGDLGDYEIGNVFINTVVANVADATTGRKRTVAQNAARADWMRGNRNSVGRKWVSKDGVATAVSAIRLNEYLSSGWALGRVPGSSSVGRAPR